MKNIAHYSSIPLKPGMQQEFMAQVRTIATLFEVVGLKSLAESEYRAGHRAKGLASKKKRHQLKRIKKTITFSYLASLREFVDYGALEARVMAMQVSDLHCGFDSATTHAGRTLTAGDMYNSGPKSGAEIQPTHMAPWIAGISTEGVQPLWRHDGTHTGRIQCETPNESNGPKE